MKFLAKMRSKKGFTLIELIVVIAIIGVLMAILIPSLIGYINTSRIRQAEANAKTAYNAAVAYKSSIDTDDGFVALEESAADYGEVDADIATGLTSGTNPLLGDKWENHVTVWVKDDQISYAAWFKDAADDSADPTSYDHDNADGTWAAYPVD